MENSELIKNALNYINQSTPSVTLEDVAKHAGFSIDYFNRIFRNHTGFNVMEYIRFRMISRAACRLRRTEDSILDIALDSGYETHESFIRAFKKQYGTTPSDYRKKMTDIPLIFADMNYNASAEGQMRNEFPEFRIVDSDEAIDYLLEHNAKRFGYDAITIRWNGSCVLTDKDLYRQGCLVAADMFFREGAYLTLKLPSVAHLRDYVSRLSAIDPWIIGVSFDEDTTEEEVKHALEGIPYKSFQANPRAMYAGEPFEIPAGPYTMRFLENKDLPAIEAWAAQRDGRDWGLKHSASTPREKHPDDQPIGMFDGDMLIGVARPSPQEAHGFKLNNCVTISLLPAYEKPELYELLYKFAVNEMMEQGYIAYEDGMFSGVDHVTTAKCGFTVFDLGFERVDTHYTIKFRS